jgi:hypothetical protein
MKLGRYTDSAEGIIPKKKRQMIAGSNSTLHTPLIRSGHTLRPKTELHKLLYTIHARMRRYYVCSGRRIAPWNGYQSHPKKLAELRQMQDWRKVAYLAGKWDLYRQIADAQSVGPGCMPSPRSKSSTISYTGWPLTNPQKPTAPYTCSWHPSSFLRKRSS